MNTSDGDIEHVGRATPLVASDISVNDIINRDLADTTEVDRNEAQAFLIDYLIDHGGQAPAGEALKAGRAAGFSDKDIKNARQRVKSPRVISRKSGFGGGWVWAFTEDSEELTKDSKDSKDSPLEGMSPSPHTVDEELTKNSKGSHIHNLSPSSPSSPSTPVVSPSTTQAPYTPEQSIQGAQDAEGATHRNVAPWTPSLFEESKDATLTHLAPSAPSTTSVAPSLLNPTHTPAFTRPV